MPSALRPFLRYVNLTMRAWAMRKFKRFAGHTRQKVIDAGIVDQNVQPAERLLRLCEDFFHIRRLCDIAAHGDRFAALGINVRNDTISAVLARGIVDDDRRAFRREPFGDSRANAF
jgi:hypothetical protein